MEVLGKSPGIAIDTKEDNFEWQIQMLNKIRDYIRQKNIKADDLFRLIDTDFSENINIANLRQFLRSELKV